MLSIKEYLTHPAKIGTTLLIHFGKWLPDTIYIKLSFRFKMGYRLNLKTPKTFTEKLQWLKLYDRNPEYAKMVDKYDVKEYVSNLIGNEYVVPTLGVWDKPENIEWDKLPNQFVLKTTHGGGNVGVVICKDKNNFDKGRAIKILNESLKRNIYFLLREWPYKFIKARIIAEKYIAPLPNQKDLPDYKFFCFNGEPKYCQVISGRSSKVCSDFFDLEWNHQPFHEPKQYPFAEVEPEKPKNLELMWNLARRLSENKPFSRIDFYDIGSNVYFGEITFFPTSGMGGFNPEKYDLLFGELIELPNRPK